MLTLIAVLALQAPATHVTRIEIERTMCFGTCPAYTASLASNGVVRYEGRAYTPRKGKWTTDISPSVIQTLDKLQARVGFQKLKDKYAVQYTDQPTTIVTVYWGQKKKTVSCYGHSSEPAGFTKLAEEVDKAIAKPGLKWRREVAK